LPLLPEERLEIYDIERKSRVLVAGAAGHYCHRLHHCRHHLYVSDALVQTEPCGRRLRHHALGDPQLPKPNQSIIQSKRYILLFTAPGTITVQRWDYSPPPAVSPAPVTVASYTLPPDIQFAVQAGFPNPGPDGFGTGATPIVFNACVVVEGGNPCVVLYPDGSAQDDAGNPGNYNNGVVYLTRPGDVYSSRAVNVWGATGRIRGWRLYKQAGVNKWVQQ
jgi:hypothetical protein